MANNPSPPPSRANDDSSPIFQEPSAEDTLLLFSDGLKDLRNLKSQLYSAAEYFEFSYMHEEDKRPVVDNLKDYVLKALVNAVDHLGSMSFKVNNLIQDKAGLLLETEARFSSIDQRIKTCQDRIDHVGLREYTFPVRTPRFHKRYKLPVGDGRLPESCPDAIPIDVGSFHLGAQDSRSILFQDVILLSARDRQPPFELVPLSQSSPSPNVYSPLPSLRLGRGDLDTGVGSSMANATSTLESLLRTDSIAATKPPLYGAPSIARRFVVEIQKSPSILKANSMRPQYHEEGARETMDHIPGKGKHFLKSLLSKRKSSKRYDASTGGASHTAEQDWS